MKPIPRQPVPKTAVCDLTVVATTDLHFHLCPWDDYADRPAPATGLWHAAGRIEEIRAASANCLLVDNGDFLQGTPMAEALVSGRWPTRDHPHPMIAAMNLLRYDAVGLGNHEFNYGLEFLGNAMAKAAFPVLCANLCDPVSLAPVFAPHVILNRTLLARDGAEIPCRIGVLSLLPPQTTIWDQHHLAGRAVGRPILRAATEAIAALRAQGADLVVVLSHSGLGTPREGLREDGENVSHALAGVGGIDALVAGHSHEVFPAPARAHLPDIDLERGLVAGVPTTQPGYGASHLGRIDLVLEHLPDTGWRRREGRGAVIDLRRLPPRPLPATIGAGFAEICSSARRASLRHLARPAGRTTAPVHSFFAPIGGCGATRLLGAALRWHVGLALADGPLAGVPVLAAVAPARAGGLSGPENFVALPAGDLTERHLTAICPFPNEIRALLVTGAEIADWLEHAAGGFAAFAPGRKTALRQADVPAYQVDQIEGLSYSLDLGKPARFSRTGQLVCPAARRIGDIRFNGVPVRKSDSFILATTSYRAAGGGDFPGTGPAAEIVMARHTQIRTILGAFLAIEGPWRPPATPAWRFAPVEGAIALFDTSPKAATVLPDRVKSEGMTPEGFLRLSMPL